MKEIKYGIKIFQLCIGIVISIFFVTTTAISADEGELSLNLTIKNRSQSEISRESADNKSVLFRGGKLTVNMPSIELNKAVEEVSRVTGIEVQWQGEEIRDVVSVVFADRSIDEAFQEMLHGESYLLYYSGKEEHAVLSRILILPSGTSQDGASHNALNHAGASIDTPGHGREHAPFYTPEMEEAGMKRVQRLEEVRAIAMLDNKLQAQDELLVELATNEEPEARILALNSLAELGEVSTDTLIDTVSGDEDPRVQLQAVDYLMKRVEQDPRAEGFLTTFFESQMGMLNE